MRPRASLVLLASLAQSGLAFPQSTESVAQSSTPANASIVSSQLSDLFNTPLGPKPQTVQQVFTLLQQLVPDVLLGRYVDFLTIAKVLRQNGIGPLDLRNHRAPAEASSRNSNNKKPDGNVYQKGKSDIKYTKLESTLRNAVYIPPAFTYGQKQPVLLVPGTGVSGYETFVGSYIPLLTGVDYADPVWVNIPGDGLGEIPINSEYVAYAINYISEISGGRPVSVITWSQGSINVQWSHKYFPSTRAATRNVIAVSPDYKGSTIAFISCPGGLADVLVCDPALFQQKFGSNFVNTLKSYNGDSAYVPTTTVYSALDEVVQPQSADSSASGFLWDARGVGVTNIQLQSICPGIGFYLHEGMLYNPLAFALAKDALVNGGAGQLNSFNVTDICNQLVAPGLGVDDVLNTENALITAAINILQYPVRALAEPLLPYYAILPPPA